MRLTGLRRQQADVSFPLQVLGKAALLRGNTGQSLVTVFKMGYYLCTAIENFFICSYDGGGSHQRAAGPILSVKTMMYSQVCSECMRDGKHLYTQRHTITPGKSRQ